MNVVTNTACKCTLTWMIWELEFRSSVPIKKLIRTCFPYFSFILAMASSALHLPPKEMIKTDKKTNSTSFFIVGSNKRDEQTIEKTWSYTEFGVPVVHCNGPLKDIWQH